MKLSYIFLFMLSVLSSCISKNQYHGAYFNNLDVKKLLQESKTKQDVLNNFGTPSVKSSIDGEKWLYISEELNQNGFLKPKVKNVNVLVFTFQNENIVTAEDLLIDENAKISLDKETTKMSQGEIKALDHFLNNIGKFNSNENRSLAKPRGLS